MDRGLESQSLRIASVQNCPVSSLSWFAIMVCYHGLLSWFAVLGLAKPNFHPAGKLIVTGVPL
jgi:hypothetical protein